MKRSTQRIMSSVLLSGLLLTTVTPAGAATSTASTTTAAQTAVSTTATSTNKAAQPSAALQARAQKLANSMLEQYGMSGMQYAIMDHGQIVLSGSAGVNDRKSKQKITSTDMFGIGSTSKMYVTAATMLLADEGKIDIDKPLIQYLPNFSMADERYRQITPRMLMDHSSGFYGSHYGNSIMFNDNNTINYDSLLDNMKTEKLKANPGAFSVYSNDSFQMLEKLVEQVGGMPYSQFVREKFSEPLNLQSTATPLDAFDRKKLVKTYSSPDSVNALPVENTNMLGTGGLYASAEDIVRFAEVLTGQRTDILSKEATDEMAKPQYRNGIWVPETSNIFNYGLGWDAMNLSPFDRYGLKAMTKGGDTILYHSSLVTIPGERLSMAVTSAGGSSIFDQAYATTVMLDLLQEKGSIKKILPDQQIDKPASTVAMPAEMKQYAGLYAVTGETFNVAFSNNKLHVAAQMSGLVPEQDYIYAGKGKFRSEDGSATVSFEKQTNGLTYMKLDGYLNLPNLSQSHMVMYIGQKLPVQKLDKSVQQAWAKRDGKTYYNVDELIQSVFYSAPSVLTKTITLDNSKSYAMATKIVDSNHSVNTLQIPVMNGRDTFDLEFYTKQKKEYVKSTTQSYINEDNIDTLPDKASSVVTLPADHVATWFNIGKDTAGKKLSVDIPTKGGFVVYTADGQLYYSSINSGNKQVTLPEGGKIVLGASANAVFKLQIKQ
ncbi:serine hydrolase domain-containing protein [Paenibacillus sp. WLX1005]|uniref:serine hydrolase domain-containing protein n=1 Tax=Paenibacillus sp. WLX1005 TaxID=3243766 RepID=UPI0039842F44